MNWFTVLSCSLATFRLAELLVIDDGPFEIFITVRGWLSRPPVNPMSIRGTVAGILACVHCTGFWIAFLFAIFFTNSIRDFIVFGLAVAGIQSILSGKLGRK